MQHYNGKMRVLALTHQHYVERGEESAQNDGSVAPAIIIKIKAILKMEDIVIFNLRVTGI